MLIFRCGWRIEVDLFCRVAKARAWPSVIHWPVSRILCVTSPRGTICCQRASFRKGLRMDWTALREQFPVTRHWAFFDHAAVTPLSAPARRAMTEWAEDMADNGVTNFK